MPRLIGHSGTATTITQSCSRSQTYLILALAASGSVPVRDAEVVVDEGLALVAVLRQSVEERLGREEGEAVPGVLL